MTTISTNYAEAVVCTENPCHPRHCKREGPGREEDHLNALDGGEIADELISILKMQKQGMTVREIAEALNIGKSTVQRRIDNARKSNVSIPEEETVPPVPNVPGVGQMGQTGYAGRA